MGNNQTPSECKHFGCCIDRVGIIIDVETNTWSCDCQNDCPPTNPKRRKTMEVATIKCLPLPKCNFKYVVFNGIRLPIELVEQIIVRL